MIKEIVKADLDESFNKGIKVLNFHATWCGPCKLLSKTFEDERLEKYDILKVDVDKDKEYAREMRVQGTPTTFIYKDGEMVKKVVGYKAVEELEDILEEII